MRKLLPLLLLTALTSACASGLKRQSPFYNDTADYDVICESTSEERGFKYYIDSRLIERYRHTSSIKEKHGAKLSLLNSDCLFERQTFMRDENLIFKDSHVYSTLCQIGTIQFAESNLQKLDEDPDANFMRRLDGKIWIIPKRLCPIFEQNTDLEE